MTSYTSKSAYPFPDPTDQVSDYPTTAQSLATYLDNLPNRNRIINGQMDVWQRGTSFSNPATGAYTADRWVFTHNGTGGTRTISQSTIAAGTLIGGMQARNALSFAVTNAGSPAASAQTIGQRIEDVRTFAGESVTISAWVANNSTALNTVTIKAIQNFGTGGSPSSAVTTTVATKAVTSSYVRVSATVTIPSISGKTLGTGDNSYLEVQFDIGNQTGTLLLWGVQVEQGTTTTALERVGISDELRRCMRYYYKHNPVNDAWPGIIMSATGIRWVLKFPVPLKGTPSVVNIVRDAGGSTAAAFSANINGNATIVASASLTTWGSPYGFTCDMTYATGGLTGGQAALVGIQSGYYIEFGAEL